MFVVLQSHIPSFIPPQPPSVAGSNPMPITATTVRYPRRMPQRGTRSSRQGPRIMGATGKWRQSATAALPSTLRAAPAIWCPMDQTDWPLPFPCQNPSTRPRIRAASTSTMCSIAGTTISTPRRTRGLHPLLRRIKPGRSGDDGPACCLVMPRWDGVGETEAWEILIDGAT